VRCLADECLDNRLLMGLRAAGHDVLAARDACPGASDPVVLELASGHRRQARVPVLKNGIRRIVLKDISASSAPLR
jgi:Domain of unknown function (DUF5615)